MNKITIVLAPAANNLGVKKILESIEGASITKVALEQKLPGGAQLMDITDFMDAFNNDEIKMPDHYMGYVTLEEEDAPREIIYCPVCKEDYYRDELSADEADEILAGEGCISLSCKGDDDDDDDD